MNASHPRIKNLRWALLPLRPESSRSTPSCVRAGISRRRQSAINWGAAWDRSDDVAPLHEDQADGSRDDAPGGNYHHGREHPDFAADAREDGDEGAGHP